MFLKKPPGSTLRIRLLRRLVYRAWKNYSIQRAQKFIDKAVYEDANENAFSVPTIFLSTYSKLNDFMVLTYLFKNQDLTLIAPDALPANKKINLIKGLNHTIPLKNERFTYSFLRQLVYALRIYNRSIVAPPEAGKQFLKSFELDLSSLVRIAMKCNVPIQPVVIDWGGRTNPENNKCAVFIGKRIFISPRHPDFKDIFFSRRGIRKFSQLNKDECIQVGERVMSKFTNLRDAHGSNLPQ
jgi:hypothetical protein